MAAIDNVVSVNISSAASPVQQQSFAIPLILGTTNPGWSTGDNIHTYSSPSGMLTDGFTVNSPEYIAASAMFAQTPIPATFKVGKRTATVAQVDTLAVNTVTAGHQYTVTVNGATFNYTAGGGDTQQAILTALNTAIQAGAPVTGVVAGTGGSALLTLTATTPGQAIIYSGVDSLLTKASVTPTNGIAQDLATISLQDNTWYGLFTPSATDADILQASAYAESNNKFYVAVSSTTAISGASTTDVLSQLKAAAYKHMLLLYSPAGIAQGAAAAWGGPQLAQTPGTNNWAYKTLAGITADNLTASQIATIIGSPVAGVAGKNGNIYTPVAGVNITQMGVTPSGQYADITVGLDWLRSQIQTNLYQLLVSQPKIPYTDAGVGALISAVRAALDLGVANTLIDGTSVLSVTAPKVASVPDNQRKNRIAPTITFACRLQGAIDSVIVNGTVTI